MQNFDSKFIPELGFVVSSTTIPFMLQHGLNTPEIVFLAALHGIYIPLRKLLHS